MSINQALLPEYDHEMANTRKTLERVPENKFDWKPHTKSMAMGPLAIHIASMPQWAGMTLATPQFDVRPEGGQPSQQPVVKTRAELLSLFDKNSAEARAAIAAASDESLMTPWSLLSAGKTIFTMPRVAVLRSMIMNHMIHHRAQLGVYLRLNDVPVPATYGPSADEGTM
jgi:uncharacterized damage-inducible protein DinB